MEIKICKECGFILGTRPNMKSEKGICLSCLNKERIALTGKDGKNG